MKTPLIQLNRFAAAAGERIILHSINLEVRSGERIAIIGGNGAGKSSLLRLLAGTLTPSRGSARVLDCDLGRPLKRKERTDLHAQVGQVFQGLHLVQRLTALENVLLGSLARNRSWLTWARLFPQNEVLLAQSLLKRVGLFGKDAMRTDLLSGGERQKVAIARMLMQQPRLILADEPTAALDPAAAADVAVLLSTLTRDRQLTLITVLHDPGLLPLLADRVIGMRSGSIAFDLPVGEVSNATLDALYRDCASNAWLTRLKQSDFPMKEES